METEKNITLEELDELERSKYLPLTIVLVVLMVIGIIGNIFVLIIYKTKFRRSSARCYILSLAMADLSVCLFGIPYHVLDLTLILTYSYTNVCKVLSFFIGACTLSSVFILLVVGLDRYLKVCRPLKKQIKDFGDRKACLLAAFVAIIISIPNGVIYGYSTVQTPANNITGVECFIDDGYHGSELAVGYLGFNMLVFIASVLFLVIIYGFICRKIYQHDKMSGTITLKKTKKVCFCCPVENLEEDDDDNNDTANVVIDTKEITESEMQSTFQESDESDEKPPEANACNSRDKTDRKVAAKCSNALIRHTKPGSKAAEKNTRKITLMMMTITIVFIIAYLPFIVISIMDTLDDAFWSELGVLESVLLDLLLRLYLINNVANPIIYSFWDQRFRREIRRLLRNLICCWKKDNKENRRHNRSVMPTSSAFTKRTEAVT